MHRHQWKYNLNHLKGNWGILVHPNFVQYMIHKKSSVAIYMCVIYKVSQQLGCYYKDWKCQINWLVLVIRKIAVWQLTLTLTNIIEIEPNFHNTLNQHDM